MKFLLYCLFASDTKPQDELASIPVLNKTSVQLFSHQELRAAASEMEELPDPSESSYLITYQQVVDFFHEQYTVIPMRYGSIFENQQALQEHLHNRYTSYIKLLEEINNCVEMGIRVLLSNNLEAMDVSRKMPEPPPSSGSEYLEKRRQFYQQQDQSSPAIEHYVQILQQEFKQVTVQYHHEHRWLVHESQKSPIFLISCHFLIYRQHVSTFQQIFHACQKRNHDQLMLSGPWPPYNFV